MKRGGIIALRQECNIFVCGETNLRHVEESIFCIKNNIRFLYWSINIRLHREIILCNYTSSTIKISWSPPFTLSGTDITGYNVSATASNGTTANHFTSNSYYELSLTDITDSPCTDSINVSVSGYNGLDGEVSQLTGIHSVPPTLPINVIHESGLLLLYINVS